MVMIYLNRKFHMPSFSGMLDDVIKLKAKYKFHILHHHSKSLRTFKTPTLSSINVTPTSEVLRSSMLLPIFGH